MLDRLSGQGGAVLITGDAGIGKSALAAAAADGARARAITVLSTTAVETESDMAWTGLRNLLEPVVDGVAELPGSQRAALEAALGREDGDQPADPYLVALAALGLLGDAADRAPLVVVVEDVHRVDRPTCTTLAFVARRLESDAIAMLLTARGDPPRALRGAELTVRRLEPLAADDASALLSAHAPELDPAVRAAVLEQAAGNPLALVELPVDAADAAGEIAAPASLPLTARLERAFAARVADLPASTRARPPRGSPPRPARRPRHAGGDERADRRAHDARRAERCGRRRADRRR